MDNRKENNFAYIDGANLHKGVASLGWKLDYKKFRIWLAEKYGIKVAYLFLGLVPKYKELYQKLQEDGFTLIFKEVIYDCDGKAKGNCDADLVLKMTRDTYENKFEKSVIITSDGDYAGLVSFLKEKQKLMTVLSPRESVKCSILLKRTGVSIAYLNDQRALLEYTNKKAPDKDGTL